MDCQRSGFRFHLQAGITLVELILVIVLLGILSAYVVMRDDGPSPIELTVPAQANKFASDVRHAQTLATTSGSPMQVIIDTSPSESYSVVCVSTCNIDFSASTEKGVTVSGPTVLTFNTLGVPSDSASYTVAYDDTAVTVAVDGLTGHVRVCPPETGCP